MHVLDSKTVKTAWGSIGLQFAVTAVGTQSLHQGHRQTYGFGHTLEQQL